MVAPICQPAEAKTWFDYFVALVPVSTTDMTALIAAYVALVSRRQAKTADRKLSLDLYDRRFQIYMRAVDLCEALPMWHLQENHGNVYGDFTRAARESTFILPEDSGVQELLRSRRCATKRSTASRARSSAGRAALAASS